jgi:glycine/D-amino acid oxidase-like deaminating enzyme
MRLAVVGGGVVGLMVAHQARAAGIADDVVLLERAGLGAGASGYAGASDVPFGLSDRHRELVRSSSAWHEAATPSVPYRSPAPALWATADEPEAARVAELVYGATVAVDEDGQLPAGVRSDGYVIDPGRLVGHLRAALLDDPATEVAEDAEVVGLHASGDTVTVSTATADLEVDLVAVCVGPWVLDACARWGLPAPQVRIKRVYGYRWRTAEPAPARTYIDLHDGVFLFPRLAEPGVWAMSVKHDVWDVAVEEGPPEPTVDEVALRHARRALGDVELVERKIFVDTYAADNQPRVGPLDEARRVWCVTATHGSGIRLAAGLADELVAHLRAECPTRT